MLIVHLLTIRIRFQNLELTLPQIYSNNYNANNDFFGRTKQICTKHKEHSKMEISNLNGVLFA